MYYSAHIQFRGAGADVVIVSMAITDDPASVGLPPLTVIAGGVRDVGFRVRMHNKTPHRRCSNEPPAPSSAAGAARASSSKTRITARRRSPTATGSTTGPAS
jgi:hypothetical protein